MPYVYKYITPEEKTVRMTDTLKSWEQDLFGFQTALDRYLILKDTLPEGEAKENVLKEIPVLEKRIEEVKCFIAAAEQCGQV